MGWRQESAEYSDKTGGGKVFWEILEKRGGYRLQKNMLFGNCRILDEDDVRVAWGEEGPMRAKLRELAGENQTGRPIRGDVIGVHRIGGVYDHYGIYESDNCVYEYAAREGDFGEADIHVTTLKRFIGDSGNYFTLIFPDQHGTPGKLAMPVAGAAVAAAGIAGAVNLDIIQSLFTAIQRSKDYHLYSPDETIRRAKSRLGESQYDLIKNNCEHFAIWCKTGLHESHQVDAFLRGLKTLPGIEIF